MQHSVHDPRCTEVSSQPAHRPRHHNREPIFSLSVWLSFSPNHSHSNLQGRKYHSNLFLKVRIKIFPDKVTNKFNLLCCRFQPPDLHDFREAESVKKRPRRQRVLRALSHGKRTSTEDATTQHTTLDCMYFCARLIATKSSSLKNHFPVAATATAELLGS